MRRLVIVVGLAALAACEPLKDAFTARADVAARAAGETLTVERLSQLAGLSKQVPLQADALRRLATVWVDYALLAVAVTEGRSLDDSLTVLTAMWPAVAQLPQSHPFTVRRLKVLYEVGFFEASAEKPATGGVVTTET